MTSPLVSVVIPARNAERTIRRQLEAVCTQELADDFEVLVVDNGSTDATAGAVIDMARIHPRISLVTGPSEPNRSAARNTGVEHCRGSLIAFCDADDVVADGWLAALVRGLETHNAVTGALVRVEAGEGPLASSSPGFPTRFRGLECLGSANLAIRCETFDEVGGFSEAFRHRVDIELSCRLHLRGASLGYVPDAQILYSRRATRRQEARQHFLWAVADVQIQKLYRSHLPFSYSWRNSVKHWILLGPRFFRAALLRRDATPEVLTFATLLGQLAGSIRYRIVAL